MKIPLSKPYWGKEEERAVLSALKNTSGAGDGPWSKKLSESLKLLTGSKYVYPVTSCTAGLELAMSVLGAGAGDEVILPSFTMTSTANCIVVKGAKPVFAEIRGDTYNIDPDSIRRLINKKTKGIIIVHYAGMPVDLEEIITLTKRNKLFLVEDAAHAIGAKLGGKMLGTFGDIGVYSFHGTKNISCGEGGAVVTDSKLLAGKIEIYRAHGTNRNKFLAGLVDKYSWVGEGSSYFLSDLLASIICAQLTKFDRIIAKRSRIAKEYAKALLPFQSLINLPVVPEGASANWHIYAIRFLNPKHRDIFIAKMRRKGIEVSSHYMPLHNSLMGQKLHDHGRDLSITDMVSRSLVRLPIYPGLTRKQLDYIINSAKKILTEFRTVLSDSPLGSPPIESGPPQGCCVVTPLG